MWILPKQLHTLDSVQDTEALNLDLNESSQLCAQSLFVRSKPSPLRTWLQKWKRDSWSQHLYGRILKPSLGKAFETGWISLLEATPANHSPQQESEQERKTQDTCGLGSQTEFGFCDQESVSLRMSKDISRWDSPASSATWKSWVIRCRGEYSLRVKSAHLTNGSGCLSWATPTALLGSMYAERNALERNSMSLASQAAITTLPTPAVMDTMGGPYKTEFVDGVFRSYHNHSKEDAPKYGARLRDAVTCGLPAPANHNTNGNRQESWATPATRDARGPRGKAANARKGNPMDTLPNQLGAKLNPRWVETLMGLPIGWCMPSCIRPVTIVPTNCDCLETESCQQLPS